MSRAVSFRDPGGFVSVTRDRVLRTVFPGGLANLNACLNSSAARRFVEEGSLVATHSTEGDAVPGRQVVEHPRIPFVSYPWEWPAAMLHVAARLTLELCAALLEEGLGLKDATPMNILFRGPRPVFIDVLSVEERNPLDPIWLADAQFARTFLIPLLLNRRTGCQIHELLLFHRDGIAPEEAVRRLPTFRAGRFENARLYRPRQAREAGEARFILARHFRSLRKTLEGLEPGAAKSAWTNYEAACPSYTNEQQAAKRQWLERTLAEIKPSRRAGCGFEHRGIQSHGRVGGRVGCVDRQRPEFRCRSLALGVCVGSRHSAAGGGSGAAHAPGGLALPGTLQLPRKALFLAVTHHLMLTDQIPLDRIFEAAASLTTRWLAIEYVGLRDPMFRRLARGRDALYARYNRSLFDDCARRSFDIVSSFDIPASDRALYLLRRKS